MVRMTSTGATHVRRVNALLQVRRELPSLTSMRRSGGEIDILGRMQFSNDDAAVSGIGSVVAILVQKGIERIDSIA